MNVFFSGWGCWMTVGIGDQDGPSYSWQSEQHKVSGVFKLDKEDEFEHKITDTFDHVRILLPSTHPKDEFSKERKAGMLVDEECMAYCPYFIFVIDATKPPGKFYPVPDEPLQTEAAKQRKKLKPLLRKTNEGLLLIYKLLESHNVEYLDELPAIMAWGKIVSQEFTSDLIMSISDSKKSITLKNDGKLSKTDFSDKYRRRFE